MHTFQKTLFVAAMSMLLTTVAFAAEVTMSIQPQQISLLNRAVLKVEFSDTDGENVEIPNVDGLHIQYQGPQRQFSFVNGRSTSKVTHVYVVTPEKTGDFTIGPILANYKGGQKKLSAQLRVVNKEEDKEAQKLSEIMFSRVSTSRPKPFVYEPFDVEIKVYIRDGIQIASSFGIEGGLPESGLDGELEWDVTQGNREEIDGTIFSTYFFRTTTKTLTAGTFVFQPEVQVHVVVPRERRRSFGFDDPFFGDMFGRQETRPYVLDCNVLEVDVRTVPMEGRPADYSGAVGEFNFDVKVGPEKVKAGEPITITTTITGNGNLSKISPPVIEESNQFKLYDARTVEADHPNMVKFQQVLIPSSSAVTNIPEIAFSYFNTQTTDFRTLKKGPFPVTVEAAPQRSAQVIATTPGTVMQETQILGRDIVYLKSQPSHWKYTSDIAWYKTNILKLVMSFPAGLLLLIIVANVRRSVLTNNVELARRQKAPKAARKHIQRAEEAIRNNDPSQFYEALWNALIDYFGHRLNLSPGEVTQQTVCSRIPQEVDAIAHLFSTIEQRHFGYGDHAAEDMKPLLKQMTETMRKCERAKS